MTSQTWDIRLTDGRIVTHGRTDKPDGTKSYWYSIDGKSGLDGMPQAEIPLYAADRLATANASESVVVVCEGEKATDALLERGVVAVGTVTGANGTPSDESLKVLLGRTVCLWADNDKQGRKHMDAIAARLFQLGGDDVRDVEWSDAPHKGDAADFTGDDKSLLELIQTATPRERPDGDLPALLNDICEFISKYVILTPAQVDTLALWVLHTWTFEAAETTPYISISSPEKQSGKTRLFETLELLVREPWLTGATSEAALFRKIDQDVPTLLFDEVDATFRGNKELENSLRGILNNGSRRGGRMSRVGTAGNFEVQNFSVYCPKAFAGIGNTLPDTVVDRSIPIELKRKTSRELVAKFRYRHVREESEELHSRIEKWADYNTDVVKQVIEGNPELPDALSDRAADGWEPLVAIADLASSAWGSRARQAATTLMNAQEDVSSGVALLRDIHAVFNIRNNPRNISSTDLINSLKVLEESPWDERQLSPHKLSTLLKQYGIKSRSVRIGDKTPKGYRREDFLDAWGRYTPDLNATPQHSGFELESSVEEPSEIHRVADTEVVNLAISNLDVADVADTTHDMKEKERPLPDILNNPYSAYSQSDQQLGFPMGDHTNSRTHTSGERS